MNGIDMIVEMSFKRNIKTTTIRHNEIDSASLTNKMKKQSSVKKIFFVGFCIELPKMYVFEKKPFSLLNIVQHKWKRNRKMLNKTLECLEKDFFGSNYNKIDIWCHKI